MLSFVLSIDFINHFGTGSKVYLTIKRRVLKSNGGTEITLIRISSPSGYDVLDGGDTPNQFL